MRLGETERVEQAITTLDQRDRDRGEVRIVRAMLALAQSDPHAATTVLAPHPPRLAHRADPEPARRKNATSTQPLVLDPLSDSEIRVLRYLPTNLSTPEIATELSVSRNTVKTHIRNLYQKLGVHRRTEAVARGRALGLLAPSAHRR